MNTFKVGDLIGFAGAGWLSTFINVVTLGAPNRSLSHVGIIGRMNGRLMLFESTLESGVIASRISQRLSRYVGRIYHYPLTRELYSHEQQRLNSFLIASVGKPYNAIGAMGSAGFLVAKSKAAIKPPNDTAYFCSALCASALNTAGLYPTPNPDRFSPNSLCRLLRYEGLVLPPHRLK
jgi:hypothetical protein